MKKNKYLLLGSSLGALLVLFLAAGQEHFFKEWRRIQWGGRSDEGPIKVQLRQVVNPGLDISDRCVSCHVSMGPGEQGVRGLKILTAHKPVVHDPAEFGCTVCHGGQGRASEKADAHGEAAFWPEPMIPVRFSYAGCGTCHAPLSVPNQGLLERARGAFEWLDCLACHRVDGRGGTIRPSGLGMEGPDLSRTAFSGYDADWYRKHLRKSQEAASGPWRTSFDPIGNEDLSLLATYMATSVAAPKLIEAKALFLSSGCLGCHMVSGVGGDEGPDLTRAGEKDPGRLAFDEVPGKATLDNWFAEHFRSPGAVVAGSAMPAVGLSEDGIELLTMYTFSLRRRELRGAYLPKDRTSVEKFGEREFAADGATIFGAFCSGCHGPEGQGRRAPWLQTYPAIASPDFLGVVSDEFILETVRRGRPGRKMPAWGEKDGGLKPEEILRAVAHLRQIGGVQSKPDPRPPRWVSADAASGKRLFEAACSGCHGDNGQGGEGPALNNKVLLATATDSYLVTTIGRGRARTAMEGFLTPSPARSALAPSEIEDIVAHLRSWEGEKK
jgi:cbb3-type cytochrome c oxidase subunit III